MANLYSLLKSEGFAVTGEGDLAIVTKSGGAKRVVLCTRATYWSSLDLAARMGSVEAVFTEDGDDYSPSDDDGGCPDICGLLRLSD